MGYLDDLRELERLQPSDLDLMRRIRKALAPETDKPDPLRDYRDQRLNRLEGIGSYEPEYT